MSKTDSNFNALNWSQVTSEAVHEAGHAVMSIHFDLPVERVFIRRDQSGRTYSLGPDVIGKIEITPLLTLQWIFKCLVHSIAGRQAETLFKEEPNPNHYANDDVESEKHYLKFVNNDMTGDMRRSVTGLQKGVDGGLIMNKDILFAAERRCVELLRTDSITDSIYKVAVELENKRVISGLDLERLLNV